MVCAICDAGYRGDDYVCPTCRQSAQRCPEIVAAAPGMTTRQLVGTLGAGGAAILSRAIENNSIQRFERLDNGVYTYFPLDYDKPFIPEPLITMKDAS